MTDTEFHPHPSTHRATGRPLTDREVVDRLIRIVGDARAHGMTAVDCATLERLTARRV